MAKKQKKADESGEKKALEKPDVVSFKDRIYNLSEKINSNDYILYSCILLALVAIVLYYPYLGFADYDIWYHLKFGEHFVTNKTFHLDHSIFSWTPADPDWKYGIWIGSSFLYILYLFAGMYGIEIFKWFIILLIPVIYFYYSNKTGDKTDITNILLVFLMLVVLNATASLVKPDNFTLIFFAVIVFIYFHTKTFSKKLFFLYPVIFLIWVNTHGGFLIGLFFISLVLVSEIINCFLKRNDSFSKRLILEFAIVVALSYLATIINPYGLSYHLYIVPTYFKSEIMGYAGRVFAFSSMWAFILSDYFKLRDSFIAAILLLIIFVTLCLYLFKTKRLFDMPITILNLIFFYLGSNASRVIPFFAIISVFSISYMIKRVDAFSLKRNLASVSIVILIFAVSAIMYDSLSKTTFRSWIPSNINAAIPDKEVSFIKKHNLPGPIFNDYLIGGYLIWALYPEYKVFIDPRYGPYWKETGPDYFNFEFAPTEQNLKIFNNRYPFKTAIFHYASSGFINLFMQSNEWQLVYFDDIAVVFVRKDTINEVSQYAFKEDISPNRFKSFSDPVALIAIFTIYTKLGFIEYAEQALSIYEKNVPSIYLYKKNDIIKMQNYLRKVTFNLRHKEDMRK